MSNWHRAWLVAWLATALVYCCCVSVALLVGYWFPIQFNLVFFVAVIVTTFGAAWTAR